MFLILISFFHRHIIKKEKYNSDNFITYDMIEEIQQNMEEKLNVASKYSFGSNMFQYLFRQEYKGKARQKYVECYNLLKLRTNEFKTY